MNLEHIKFKCILQGVWLLLLITSCNYPGNDVLRLDPIMISYTLVQTQTDYFHAENASFKMKKPSGKSVTLPIPMNAKPGWISHENKLLFYAPPCLRWSQDGQFAAFNDGRDVTIYDSVEGNVTTIYVDFDLIRFVTWLPDNVHLVFEGSPTVGQTDIWLVNTQSEELSLFLNCNHCSSPSLSSDGEFLAYADVVNHKIIIVDINAKTVVKEISIGKRSFDLLAESPYLAWSPNNDYIAFNAIDPFSLISNIFIVNVNSQEIKMITSPNEVADSPVWSPSGEQLLYRSIIVSDQVLPDEEPVMKETNLKIASFENGKNYEIVPFSTGHSLIVCPQWLPASMEP